MVAAAAAAGVPVYVCVCVCVCVFASVAGCTRVHCTGNRERCC